MNDLVFTKKGYDSFIDFLKAISILLVLLGHTLPGVLHNMIGYRFWMGMAVPVFLCIQAFHYYKRSDSKINLKKILRRIIKPFIVIELIIVIVLLSSGRDKLLVISEIVNGGGVWSR